jgi:hypothetical protein
MMRFPKHNRIRDRAWLDEVRDQPCIITGTTPCDPAHIRYGLSGGMGLKPDDNRVLPLAHELHRQQHDIGEISFWTKQAKEDAGLIMRLLIEVAELRYDLRNRR